MLGYIAAEHAALNRRDLFLFVARTSYLHPISTFICLHSFVINQNYMKMPLSQDFKKSFILFV